MSKLGKEIAAGHQPMFMTPDEVAEHTHLGDAPFVGDFKSAGPKSSEQKAADEKTLAQKLEASHGTPAHDDGKSFVSPTSLYDSIKEKGVTESVSIGKLKGIKRPVLIDGHHRLAASRHLNPHQFLSVEYR